MSARSVKNTPMYVGHAELALLWYSEDGRFLYLYTINRERKGITSVTDKLFTAS